MRTPREHDVTLGEFVGMMCAGPLLLLRFGLILTGLHDRRNWYR